MIYHIYWGTGGTSGLYLDEIYNALSKKGYSQKVFVSYYYPFNYGEKIFFRFSDIGHCSHKGLSRKIIQLLETIYALCYMFFLSIIEKPKMINFSLVSKTRKSILYFLKILKFFSGAKLIITCHDVCPFDGGKKNENEYQIRKKIFQVADYLLVHNDNSKNDLKDFFNITENVIYHRFPIKDLSKLYDIGDYQKKIDFLFIGVLRYEKGIDFLLQTWPKFHEIHRNAVLSVSGYSSKDMKQYIDLLQSKNVIFDLRYIPDDEFCEMVQSARYVVLPYLKGTNSGILSDVLSLGTEVIVSNISMFQNNPLISEGDMFISEDESDFLRVLEAKYLNHTKTKSRDIIEHYRTQFSEEVANLYKSLI